MDPIKKELSKISGIGLLQFQIDTQTIIKRLDRVIELLELRDDPNRKLTKEEAREEYYPLLEPTETDGDVNQVSFWAFLCNCGNNNHGALTGGWHCPIHGQCY